MIEATIAFILLNLYLVFLGWFTAGLFSDRAFDSFVRFYTALRFKTIKEKAHENTKI